MAKSLEDGSTTLAYDNSITDTRTVADSQTRGTRGRPKTIEERYGTGIDGQMRVYLHKRGFDPENIQGAKETWPNNTPMHEAGRRGHTKVMLWLHKNGAAKDVMAKNWHGDTPLHGACEKGSLDACQFLIKNGGLPSLRTMNKYGCTPFHIAAVKGHSEICEWLDSAGYLKPSAFRAKKKKNIVEEGGNQSPQKGRGKVNKKRSKSPQKN